MMKTPRLFLLALLISGMAAQAQTMDMAAKDPINEVFAQVQSEYSSDAFLANVMFLEMNNGLINMLMDISTGRTSGWVYPFYSPSKDSLVMAMVFDMPVLGRQILVVEGEGQVSLNGDVPQELTEPWLDSPDAMTAAHTAGVDDFVQRNPDAAVKFAVCGYTAATQGGVPGNYWIFQISSASDTMVCVIDAVTGASVLCSSVLAVEGIPAATGMRLDQNYPNPVSLSAPSVSVIRFAVADRRPVRLALFDCLGRELSVLKDEVMDAGEYTATIPAGAISTPGVYYYRLETPAGVATRKLIVAH